MEDAFLGMLAIAVMVGIVRPIFWWLALGLSLWVGRKICSPKWGKIVFGRYW